MPVNWNLYAKLPVNGSKMTITEWKIPGIYGPLGPNPGQSSKYLPALLQAGEKFTKFHLVWQDWRPGSWIPDRGMIDILIQCCHNARVNMACLFIYTNWRLHMNVKLGQLDLFSPLCKICEKTELCSQGLADGWLMSHVVSVQIRAVSGLW